MKKVVIIFAVFIQLMLISSAWSLSTSRQDAQRAALAWLNICPSFMDGNYSPGTEMIEIKDESQQQVVAYVMMLQPRGFIVIAPDDDLDPVIAFSEKSNFDGTDTPENVLLNLLRNDIADRKLALQRGDIGQVSRNKARSLWQNYLQKVDKSGRVSVENMQDPMWDVEHGPFLTSEWSQDVAYDNTGSTPYPAVWNYYTPLGPDGDPDNHVSGCVSTAFAQILNYYEWPNTGTSSYSYTWDNGSDPAETLSADFGSTTYDWSKMRDIYFGQAFTLEERQQAGLLTYHCGVAVDMNYAAGGSGAQVTKVASALQNYFRSYGVYVANSGDFYDRLYDNMLKHRPAEIGIRNDSFGHAVVVDGVRNDTGGTKYYHLNMGWGGVDDAWYDLPVFTATNAGYTFDTVDGAVMDIVPSPDMTDPGTTSTSPDFAVEWDVSPQMDATAYKLQQMYFSSTLGNFSEGAEDGIDNWTDDGYWGQYSSGANQGTYSFIGQVYQAAAGFYFPGILTLDRSIKIDNTTTIEYYWKANEGDNRRLSFQISVDGTSWTNLKTHTGNTTSWALESVTTAELAAYIGEIVSVRFVLDYLGGQIYVGLSYGFYVDDFLISNASLSEWTTVDSTLSTESCSISATANGDYIYRVCGYRDGQWWGWSDYESITVSATTMNAKIFLEGIYNSGEMDTTLKANGYIPLTSPYTEDPSTVSSIPLNTVDWVLLQLVDKNDDTNVLYSKSLFLRNDGFIMDENGIIQPLINKTADDYYIVVKHRNHLSAMSKNVVELNSSSTLYDFTADSAMYYGSNGTKELGDGKWGMWTGDINQDGQVTTSDYTQWYNSARAGDSGYNTCDINLDGQVTTSDYTLWYNCARAGAASTKP